MLVFWFDSIEIETKKDKYNKLNIVNSKWKTIEGLFAKAGSSVNLEKRSESDIAKLLVNSAKKRNCTISSDNARYLISVFTPATVMEYTVNFGQLNYINIPKIY